MASLSSPGIGSGLDVTSLVSQLVTAAKTPQQDSIDSHRSQVTAQLSAIGSLTSVLSSLQTALAGLSDGSAFTQFIATASNADHFSAIADASAAAGTYSIDVDQLATAQKASSAAFASDTTFASGSLTVSVGDKTLTVPVGSGNRSLAQLAGAINRSSANPGVTASVVHATDGYHLVMTSSQTGAANAFKVSGTGDLAGVSYDPAGGGSMTTVASAQDAKLSIDGFAIASASNAVTGAIQGVTINLAQVTGDTPDTLTVAPDNASIATSVQNFVTAYNKFVSTTKSLTSYDASSGTSGPLLGDSTLLGIASRLSRALGTQIGAEGSAVRSLSDVGIHFQVDGTLSLDSDKLNSALSASPEQVKSLFGNASGYGSTLTPMLQGYLQTGGILDGRTDSLNKSSKSLDDQQSQLDARMDTLKTMYTTQFTKLDQLLSSLSSTSTFLTQQLTGASSSK